MFQSRYPDATQGQDYVLYNLQSVFVDISTNNILLADGQQPDSSLTNGGTGRVVLLSPAGDIVLQFPLDAHNPSYKFDGVNSLVLDSSSRYYVADGTGSGRIVVLNSKGNLLNTSPADSSYSFNGLTSVTVDALGFMYAADFQTAVQSGSSSSLGRYLKLAPLPLPTLPGGAAGDRVQRLPRPVLQRAGRGGPSVQPAVHPTLQLNSRFVLITASNHSLTTTQMEAIRSQATRSQLLHRLRGNSSAAAEMPPPPTTA